MTQQPKKRSGQKRESQRTLYQGLLIPVRLLITKVRFVAARITLARRNDKDRNTLSRLTDRQLRDIGLTRDNLESELGRGVFDIPSQRFYEVGFRQGGFGSPKQPRISRLPKD